MSRAEDRALPQVNAHIIEKLRVYPEDVREVATQAVRLAETYAAESTIVEMLDATIRKLAKQRHGTGQ